MSQCTIKILTLLNSKCCFFPIIPLPAFPVKREDLMTPSGLFFLASRDVSSVELLQKYHQGIRSEIEARQANFTDCTELGRTLLTRKHRDSAEVGAPTAAFISF